jgi:hypothetical protein
LGCRGPPEYPHYRRSSLAGVRPKLQQLANIKLDSVISDIMRKSGRAMIKALIAGERDPDKLARRRCASSICLQIVTRMVYACLFPLVRC